MERAASAVAPARAPPKLDLCPLSGAQLLVGGRLSVKEAWEWPSEICGENPGLFKLRAARQKSIPYDRIFACLTQ